MNGKQHRHVVDVDVGAGISQKSRQGSDRWASPQKTGCASEARGSAGRKFAHGFPENSEKSLENSE